MSKCFTNLLLLISFHRHSSERTCGHIFDPFLTKGYLSRLHQLRDIGAAKTDTLEWDMRMKLVSYNIKQIWSVEVGHSRGGHSNRSSLPLPVTRIDSRK